MAHKETLPNSSLSDSNRLTFSESLIEQHIGQAISLPSIKSGKQSKQYTKLLQVAEDDKIYFTPIVFLVYSYYHGDPLNNNTIGFSSKKPGEVISKKIFQYG
jgi:hypothetical protein